jgi:hypothetical protein
MHPREKEPLLKEIYLNFNGPLVGGHYQCRNCCQPIAELDFDKNLEFADSLSNFKRGDTVTIKLCNIDKGTYDFWRTYEFSFQSIGNPFSSPTRILGNISNDALGYFGGYGAQYRTVIIPK